MSEQHGDIVSSEDAGTEPNALVVYCRSWCPDCRRAKAWLEERDIPYVEVDVDDDDDARRHAASLNDGSLHTPTFELGDSVCVDFRPQRIREILDLP